MAEPTHDCPAGCGTQVDFRRFACPADWNRLPKQLRDEIYAAYKRKRSDPMRHIEAMAAAIEWYQGGK